MSAPRIIRNWSPALAKAGFDLVAAFDTARYNRSELGQGVDFRLQSFGREGALALVVGNTRALWAPFVRAVGTDPRLRSADHPLNRYTEGTFAALQRSEPVRSQVLYGHRDDPRVPIQRVAAVAGLADLSPSHMSVHPRFGPWLGLRAVVVFDCEPPEMPASAAPTSPCQGCTRPCLGALRAALDSTSGAAGSWQAWLALRDSCPVGRGARYGAAQIRYHYTKSRDALDEF